MEPPDERKKQELHQLTDFPIVIREYADEGKLGQDIWVVDVGNTGLFLVLYGGPRPRAEQHFLPDGFDHPVAGKEKQYAETYAMALLDIIDWWKTNQKNPPELPKFDTLDCYTNIRMHNFLKRLLGESLKEMGNIEDDYFSKLNLEELLQDTTILNNVGELAEICRQQHYTTTEAVPQGDFLSAK